MCYILIEKKIIRRKPISMLLQKTINSCISLWAILTRKSLRLNDKLNRKEYFALSFFLDIIVYRTSSGCCCCLIKIFTFIYEPLKKNKKTNDF